jgi:hypothetical protein
MPAQELRRRAQWSATALMAKAAAGKPFAVGSLPNRHAWLDTRVIHAASVPTHLFLKFGEPMDGGGWIDPFTSPRWSVRGLSVRPHRPFRVAQNHLGQPAGYVLNSIVSPGWPKLLGNFTLSVENTNTMELVIGDVVLWAQHTVGARVILIVLYLNLVWMWLLYL